MFTNVHRCSWYIVRTCIVVMVKDINQMLPSSFWFRRSWRLMTLCLCFPWEWSSLWGVPGGRLSHGTRHQDTYVIYWYMCIYIIYIYIYTIFFCSTLWVSSRRMSIYIYVYIYIVISCNATCNSFTKNSLESLQDRHPGRWCRRILWRHP